ncbi:helix-turn-helix transcriptional regulator [Streptomyces sp. CT34]|uniref:helix-turn-helix transcriptional regulator n=1 Tax=Streptomyces sp. CT34 TaxID=1553907 RepID=UPI0005B853E2|nr:helix-turn-helix transcriptional regulator [Streptomyces sp. CT34]
MSVLTLPQPAPSAGRGNARLHAAMVEAGLSYPELANRLGVDPKTVERWVNEPGRRPYARHCQAVARVLGTTVWDLWPALDPSPSPSPAFQPVSVAARDALSRAESVNLGQASTTEMALHLGAVSSALRTVLDLLDAATEAMG